MRRRLAIVEVEERYDLETTRGILEATEWDVAQEDARMRGLDAKLTQLASFSGVSISISGGLGANVLVGGDLGFGFLVSIGACVGIAVVLLLAGVITAFLALAPKAYQGVDEGDVLKRVSKGSFRREASAVMSQVASTRYDILVKARTINDRKAAAATRVFWLVSFAFTSLILSLLLTAVASVL